MVYTLHGILQARILQWVAFPFCKGSSQLRDQTQVSRIAGGFFTSRATREAQSYHMTQQSHYWAYTLRKPELKKMYIPQCLLQHNLQYLGHGNNPDVHP